MGYKHNKQERCCRCLGKTELTIHHIWPQSRGGDHRIENLATLCRPCHVAWHALESKSGWNKLSRGSMFRMFHAWIVQSTWLRGQF